MSPENFRPHPPTNTDPSKKHEQLPYFDIENDFRFTRGLRAELRENTDAGFLRHIRTIHAIVNDPRYFLNKGGAGYVYRFRNAGIAVKIVLNRHRDPNATRYNLGNSPRQEAMIQRSLERITGINARSPRVWDVIEGQRYAALLMERVEGMNLHQIVSDPQRLPEGFDGKKVHDEIGEYIQKMHAEGRVAHNDLALRNIMFDVRTLRPIIIDFGRATSLAGLSEKECDLKCDDDWWRWEGELDTIRSLT